MDFSLSAEIGELRTRYRDFVERSIIPLEDDPASYDEHENVRLDLLERLRRSAREAGLWAPQMPREWGGQGLGVVGMSACYEEMGRSIFGPVTFNCAAPDNGNMILLEKAARDDQKARWLEWMYRYARQARLVDGASEVHKMVLARRFLDQGQDFWDWS